jgi:hypothetical protein
VLPVLRPAIPSWPSSVLVLRIVPATGTTAVGVHPSRERGLAVGVPPRECPGHVVGRRQQQRLQRMALGDRLAGGDGHQRVTAASLRRHVRGHQLGGAGDRHRPGRAQAVRYADAADVSGRDPAGRPRNRAQPLLAWSGCPGPRRDRPGGRGRLGMGCHRPRGRCLQLPCGAARQASAASSARIPLSRR